MAGPALKLDWRDTPHTNTILNNLVNIVQDIADNSATPFVLSGSLLGPKGAKACWVDRNGSIVEEADADNTCVKLFTCVRPKPTKKRAVTYLIKVSVVASKICQIISRRVPAAQRQFGYNWPSQDLNAEMARSLTIDLALTIGVHPFALGVIPESGGRFSVPPGFRVECIVCDNIFDYADDHTKGTRRVTINQATLDAPIPGLTVSLEVKSIKGGKPTAVIITEHKNIKFQLMELMKAKDKRFEGVWFVMTGGFSDQSTREFVHLLSIAPIMKDVKFIFISDRDPHAVEIFSNLKHGSRQAAYMSLTSCCPQLRYGGITIDRYKKLAAALPARKFAEWKKEHRAASREDQDKELDNFKRNVQLAMIDSLKEPAALLNAADEDRLRHLWKYKLFSTQYEPELYKDLLAMGMNDLAESHAINPDAVGEKFGLAKLNKQNSDGIVEALVDVMKDFNVAPARGQAPASGVHPGTALWHALGTAFTPQIMVIANDQRQDDTAQSTRGVHQGSASTAVARSSGTIAVQQPEADDVGEDTWDLMVS